MKPRQVPFFLYWSVENVQFCINAIGHLCWLRGISNFPRFHKNVKSLELWKYISENTSPKGSFWRNKRKSEFSDLSSDSPYLQAKTLKSSIEWLIRSCCNVYHGIRRVMNTHLIHNQLKFLFLLGLPGIFLDYTGQALDLSWSPVIFSVEKRTFFSFLLRWQRCPFLARFRYTIVLLIWSKKDFFLELFCFAFPDASIFCSLEALICWLITSKLIALLFLGLTSGVSSSVFLDRANSSFRWRKLLLILS